MPRFVGTLCIGIPRRISAYRGSKNQTDGSGGTAYAATPQTAAANAALVEKPIETRFVLWFNGNGIPERYWIPTEEGSNYELTPCLAPLAGGGLWYCRRRSPQ